MNSKELPTIGIIGAGRFGSFMAKQLDVSTSSHLLGSIYIYDNDPLQSEKVVETSKSTLVGDRTPIKSVKSLKTLVAKSKIIILAIPNRESVGFLKKLAPILTKDHIVVDVCSLKEFACKAMKEILPKFVRKIGTHPLFGPQSAHGLLSANRTSDLKIALCNISADKKTVKCFKSFFSDYLKLEVIECTPEEHDRQMAISQALTHFMGRVFERMDIQRVQMTTKSFDNLMNIVDLVKGGSPELFEDMQTLNLHASDARKLFIEESSCLDLELCLKTP